MITIYSKANCPKCTNAKALLTSYDIDFHEERIDENQEARDFLLGEGHKSVPQLYVGQFLLGSFTKLTSMTREEILDKVNE